MALLGPEAGLLVFILMAGVVAFAGATQDIAVDAYRIEIAPVEAQGALAATYTLGYRIALIASTVGVLYVAQFWSWRVAYLSMAALMLVPLVTTLVAREPPAKPGDRAARGFRRGLRRTVPGVLQPQRRRAGGGAAGLRRPVQAAATRCWA